MRLSWVKAVLIPGMRKALKRERECEPEPEDPMRKRVEKRADEIRRAVAELEMEAQRL